MEIGEFLYCLLRFFILFYLFPALSLKTEIEKDSVGTKFFYLCLALSIFVNILVCLVLPADQPQSVSKTFNRIDVIGGTILVSGLTMLVISLSINSHHSWTSPIILSLFISSLVLIVLFITWQYYLELHQERLEPLIRLSIFKKPCFGSIQTISALLWLSYKTQNYFLNQ